MFDGAKLLGKVFEGSYGSYGDKSAWAKEAIFEKEAWAKKADYDDRVADKKRTYLESQGQGWGVGSTGTGGFLGSLARLFGGGNARPATPSFGERYGSGAAVGGLALVGGLAYAAWQAYSNRNQATAGPPAATQAPTPPMAFAPPPAGSGFTPPQQDAPAQHALGTLLVRAMISAAKSDGQMDAQETQRIFGEMTSQNLSQAEKAFLMEEIGRPVDVDALAAQAQSPQVAAQVYTASAMVIGAQAPQETEYLRTLAQKLRLEPGLVAEIHQQLQVAARPPA